MSSVGATTGGGRRWLRTVPPGKSSGRLRQKLMPAWTSRTPSRTFSGVTRLMRPSSSSSPQSPQVEPSGRCVQRFVMSSPSRPAGGGLLPPRVVEMYRPVGLISQLRSRSQRTCFSARRATRVARHRRSPGMTQKDFVVSADGHLLEPIDLFKTRLPEAPAPPGGVGGGVRDRALRRGRRPGLPQAAHARVRGLDRLALPPDERAHARGRPRHHPRGHGRRRGRRPGAAPEPLAVRALHRPPRDVDRPRPRLQRLRDGAVHAVLPPAGPHRADPAHRHRRRGRRDRAGGGGRVPRRAAARHRADALLPGATTTRCGRRSRTRG